MRSTSVCGYDSSLVHVVALQVSDHVFNRFFAVEHLLEQTALRGHFGHRRRPAEHQSYVETPARSSSCFSSANNGCAVDGVSR